MLPSLCQLSSEPSTAGFLPEGKPDYDAPGCDADNNDATPGGKRTRAECNCAICLGPLSNSETYGAPYIFAQSCEHQFHDKCIYGWVYHGNAKCPTCRRPIPAADIDAIKKVVSDDTKEWIGRVIDNPLSLEQVPKDRTDYKAIALAAVAQNGLALTFVLPKDRTDYREIALVAVAQNGLALHEVPKGRTDYKAIALAAVAQNGWALDYVPKGSEDYREIALVAMAQNGLALDEVPKGRTDYREIALVAVAQNGLALDYVPKGRTDYKAIALVAVAQNGLALDYVESERADYDEIVRAAGRASTGTSFAIP